MENRSGSDGSDCVMAYSGIAVSGSILSLTDLFMDLNNDLATLYGYYNYVMNSIPYVIGGGILAAYTCLMFLVGYLSLVRRLKAGTMWKNSVLHMIVQFVHQVSINIGSVWKVVIIFGGLFYSRAAYQRSFGIICDTAADRYCGICVPCLPDNREKED